MGSGGRDLGRGAEPRAEQDGPVLGGCKVRETAAGAEREQAGVVVRLRAYGDPISEIGWAIHLAELARWEHAFISLQLRQAEPDVGRRQTGTPVGKGRLPGAGDSGGG